MVVYDHFCYVCTIDSTLETPGGNPERMRQTFSIRGSIGRDGLRQKISHRWTKAEHQNFRRKGSSNKVHEK